MSKIAKEFIARKLTDKPLKLSTKVEYAYDNLIHWMLET